MITHHTGGKGSILAQKNSSHFAQYETAAAHFPPGLFSDAMPVTNTFELGNHNIREKVHFLTSD